MWMLSVGTYYLETVRFEKLFHNYLYVLLSCWSLLCAWCVLNVIVFIKIIQYKGQSSNWLADSCDGFLWFIGTQETDSTLSNLVEMLHVHVYWHITSRLPVYINKSTPLVPAVADWHTKVKLLDVLNFWDGYPYKKPFNTYWQKVYLQRNPRCWPGVPCMLKHWN